MRTTPRGYKTPEAEDILPQSAGHIRETLETIDGEQTGQDAALAAHGGRLDGLDTAVSGHGGRLDGLDAALLSLADDLTQTAGGLTQDLADHNTDPVAHAAAIAAQRPWATAGEAVAGTSGDRVMSPARVAEAIAALTPTPDVAGQIDGRLDDIMIVAHEVPSGTHGGTFTAGAWRTRALNTVVANNIPGASLYNYQITLPAGRYDIGWMATAREVNGNVTRLYNLTTDDYVLGLASTSNINYYEVCLSHGRAIIDINRTCAFCLEHICEVTHNNTGFGVGAPFGYPNRFAGVFIRKIG